VLQIKATSVIHKTGYLPTWIRLSTIFICLFGCRPKQLWA